MLLPVLLSVLLLVAAPVHAAQAAPERFGIGVETGSVWIARNDVRIPGDDGTRFDAAKLLGSQARAFARFSAHWHIDERHSVHGVYAPLDIIDDGRLVQDALFEGETFRTGAAQGTYRFNAYKLTYRYTFRDRGRWRWGLGFTGVVRDAKIALRQGELAASNENVGFVPALHLMGRYARDDRWSLTLDADGLAGGPGRLLDLALKLNVNLGPNWQVSGGYRTLEGGADTDKVYNFAWLNYAAIDIRYRF